jgi:thiamine kinase-like enzyme
MNPTLDRVLEDHLNWRKDEVLVDYEKDGLTNENYTVTRNTEKFVIRIPNEKSTKYLGINREAEFTTLESVQSLGICPEVVFFDPSTGVMISRYINGRKIGMEEMKLESNLARATALIKSVHGLEEIPYSFSPYNDIAHRIAIARERNIQLPEALGKFEKKLEEIRIDREKDASAKGLCHNDPFYNNFLDDGALRLLDWEYAGMGDTFFDLAAISYFFSEDQKRRMLELYFGEYSESNRAKLEKMTYVVSFWNGMWAVLQEDICGNNGSYRGMANYIFDNLEKHVFHLP